MQDLLCVKRDFAGHNYKFLSICRTAGGMEWERMYPITFRNKLGRGAGCNENIQTNKNKRLNMRLSESKNIIIFVCPGFVGFGNSFNNTSKITQRPYRMSRFICKLLVCVLTFSWEQRIIIAGWIFVSAWRIRTSPCTWN